VVNKLQKKLGFVFSPLSQLGEDWLTIEEKETYLHNEVNGSIVFKVSPGIRLPILEQNSTSEVIRPYGRNFWYRVLLPNNETAWVYGGYTSQKTAPVNCQCVDYIKSVLKITGPTKHAKDWGDVLLGQIEVSQNGQLTHLNYSTSSLPQTGDIAVFSNTHSEVNQKYGHIGIIRNIKMNQGKRLLLIEGANHDKLHWHSYYQVGQCNNISKKWYSYNSDITFYQK